MIHIWSSSARTHLWAQQGWPSSEWRLKGRCGETDSDTNTTEESALHTATHSLFNWKSRSGMNKWMARISTYCNGWEWMPSQPAACVLWGFQGNITRSSSVSDALPIAVQIYHGNTETHNSSLMNYVLLHNSSAKIVKINITAIFCYHVDKVLCCFGCCLSAKGQNYEKQKVTSK